MTNKKLISFVDSQLLLHRKLIKNSFTHNKFSCMSNITVTIKYYKYLRP